MAKYEQLNSICDSTESTSLLTDIQDQYGSYTNNANSRKNERSKTFKVVESVFIACLYVSWGLGDAVIVPSTDDLRHLLNCNYEQVMRLTVAKNVGLMIGGPLAALSLDRFESFRELQISVTLLLSGLCLAAAPWCSSLAVMTSLFFILGICCGSFDCGGNAMTTHLWGASATVPLLLVHFGYAIGTIVAPVIAGPFLAGYSDNKNGSHSNGSDYMDYLTEMQPMNNDAMSYELANSRSNIEHAMTGYDHQRVYGILEHEPVESRIYIPFGIIACFTTLTAFMFLSVTIYNFCIHKQDMQQTNLIVNQQRPALRTLVSPASCADGNLLYGSVMLTLTVFLYLMFTGRETPIFTFVTVLAEDRKLHFSIKEGTFLTTMFFVAYSVGRLTAAFIGLFVNIKVLIFIELAFAFTSQILLILFAYDSHTSFWLCMLFFGFCSGPIFPSGMGWIDRYLRMSTLAYSAITIGASSGGFIFSWLSGYLMDHYEPKSIFYLSMICCCVATMVLAIMQVIGARHGDRFLKKESMEVIVNGNINDDDEPLLDA